MPSKPELYPAVHIIFTFLSAIRRGVVRKNIWREHLHRAALDAVQVFRRQKIALKPRLAFWLALCKETGLVDEYDNQLRVTRHARAWLNKPTEAVSYTHLTLPTSDLV